MKYVMIALTLMLSACASTPMTQERCNELGGDTMVEFKEHGWQCCKVVPSDSGKYNHHCKVVNEPREPREPRLGRDL